MRRAHRLTPYEHRSEPLLPRRLFLQRVAVHALLSFLVLTVSLGIGVLGYHRTENLAWIDALVNASMILGGMGPVDALHTAAGKLFASFYSLYSGMVFLVAAGVLVAPVAHRFLHWVGLQEENRAAGGDVVS